MSLLDALTQALQPWATLYSDSTPVHSVVLFTHLAGVLLGGGLAIAADRSTLRVLRSAEAVRHHHLVELHGVHRPVLIGLALALASGTLMLAADLKTFAESPLFWIKMGVIVALLANGYQLQCTERRLRAALGHGGRDWTVLRRSAVLSLALWFVALLLGALLPSVA